LAEGTKVTAFQDEFLSQSLHELRTHKALADGALRQIADADLHVQLDKNTNSIAIIMQHMSGNMLSRWTDFLTSDGEKPGRNRDGEFEEKKLSRAELMAQWEKGWACVFAAIGALAPGDLLRTITIRGKPLSVTAAIQRQVAHYGYHVGQIVLLARFFAKDNWQSLSIPRGKSDEYNRHIGYSGTK
jgi:hypothetical protein